MEVTTKDEYIDLGEITHMDKYRSSQVRRFDAVDRQASNERGALLELDAHGASDSGRRRLNEDQFLIADLAEARRRDGDPVVPSAAAETLLVVADGMGGHPSGEIASLMAVRVVVRELLQSPPTDSNPLARLDRAIRASDEALHRAGTRRDDLASMGTTLTAAWWVPPMLYFAHVGHSRLYLWRGGRLTRLTRDHTLAVGLTEAGFEARKVVGFEHVLTQALGGDQRGVEPEAGCRRLGAGDALLLCTDGLIRGLTDDDIARTLAQTRSARAAAAELIGCALAADDHDNVTALVARVTARSRFPGGRSDDGAHRRSTEAPAAQPVSATHGSNGDSKGDES